MGRGGCYPRITCPGCGRWPVRVGPNSERIQRHTDRRTGERCASTGQQIDLYGTEETRP